MISIRYCTSFLLIVPLKWNLNQNLNAMHNNDPNYYYYYVPDDQFMEFWSNDVVDFEPAGDKDNGWIFWYSK